tara:strand:+ start:123 stop:458 length:336 start_codon:yes stop_codon:yes gene_type:complete
MKTKKTEEESIATICQLFKNGREEHRKQFSDIEWQNQQPRGLPKYKIGDVIEFEAGGLGVIREVNIGRGGHPSSYATDRIEGLESHPTGKCAWHYEGDFKNWIAKSPLHTL